MNETPWTSDDPQPGDFDADLAAIDPRYLAIHDGGADAKLRVLVSIEGEDATRLERIADARGKTPREVVADLLRAADRSAA